ncbi:MFS transporter [Priestia megaterium]|uniref:MFS transporter n=1 Tax=Priestia megaterium TaxID=1404 RepID=UPI00366ED655
MKEKIGYGMGDFASILIWGTIGSFLTFYYTDSIGLSAGFVGTLMLIARVFDAFIDILIGNLVDKTKSKHGKARPWLLWMCVPFAIFGVLLFTVPDVGKTWTILYVYVTYLLMNGIYSAINVPYGVLNSLITQDSYQRSVLNIFRMAFSLCSGILVNFLTMPLVKAFGGSKQGWSFTMAIFSIVGMVLFLFTFKTTKERVKPTVVTKEIPFKSGVKALFRNKYWIIMVVFAVVFFINWSLSSGMNIYYAKYVLNNNDLVGIIGMTTLMPMLIGYLFLAPFIKRFGKRNIALVGSVLLILGSVVISLDPTNLTMVIVGLIIKAIGNTPIMGTIFAMLADTIEYGEWKTGLRTEGLVYSAGSFGTKVGTGVGTAVIGWGLALGGYVGGQTMISDSALTSIKWLYIYVPIILSVMQIIVLAFHNLDKQYSKIIKDLQWIKSQKL